MTTSIPTPGGQLVEVDLDLVLGRLSIGTSDRSSVVRSSAGRRGRAPHDEQKFDAERVPVPALCGQIDVGHRGPQPSTSAR